MNLKKLTLIAFGIGFAGATVYDYIKFANEQKQVRAQIQQDADLEIAAMQKAHAIMTEKIQNGEYLNVGIPKLMEDFEFFTITSRPVKE